MARKPVVQFQDDWNDERILEVERTDKESISFLSFLECERDWNVIRIELNKDSLKDLISILENALEEMED